MIPMPVVFRYSAFAELTANGMKGRYLMCSYTSDDHVDLSDAWTSDQLQLKSVPADRRRRGQ